MILYNLYKHELEKYGTRSYETFLSTHKQTYKAILKHKDSSLKRSPTSKQHDTNQNFTDLWFTDDKQGVIKLASG